MLQPSGQAEATGKGLCVLLTASQPKALGQAEQPFSRVNVAAISQSHLLFSLGRELSLLSSGDKAKILTQGPWLPSRGSSAFLDIHKETAVGKHVLLYLVFLWIAEVSAVGRDLRRQRQLGSPVSLGRCEGRSSKKR